RRAPPIPEATMPLFLLLACAADPVSVPDGHFRLDHATDGSGTSLGEAELGEVALALLTDDGTGAVTVTDGDDVHTLAFGLTLRDRADWHAGCPTNLTTTPVETFDLDTDTLVVGPLTLTTPVLTATCGEGDEGDPVLASWVDGALAEPMIVFRAI
ncbi:MAG: hypothetical protein ACK4YP_19475, partial [Myxococcota bacterium]